MLGWASTIALGRYSMPLDWLAIKQSTETISRTMTLPKSHYDMLCIWHGLVTLQSRKSNFL
jgi:hypothetical protein